MALWDSADLLRRCKLLARRPAVDAAVPDASWYDWLTEAQVEVYPEIFSRRPELGYSDPVLLTTADGGKTYTFGNDVAGDSVRPTGHAEIYPNLASIPDSPLTPGSDFMLEGAKIRMPANRTRVFANGPYARFVVRPDVAINAGVQPLLQPKNARMLLVWKALERWASRPGSGARPEYYEGQYDKALNKLFLEFATEYNRAGAQGGAYNPWMTIGDLGANGLNR